MTETMKNGRSPMAACGPFMPAKQLSETQLDEKISCLQTALEASNQALQDDMMRINKFRAAMRDGKLSDQQRKEYEGAMQSLATTKEAVSEMTSYVAAYQDEQAKRGQGKDDPVETPPSRIKDKIEAPENAVDMPLLKSPTNWTLDELKAAMKMREKAGVSSGEKAKMMGREQEWFTHFYGNGPVQHDETGKMRQPMPVRPIPETPQPVLTRDGVVLDKAMDDVYTTMPVIEEPDERELAKAIQSGLNLISGRRGTVGPRKDVKLKEDGVIGPKTSTALKKAVVDNGTPHVSEAVALGQFKNTVKQAKKGEHQNLAADLSRTFDPLLPKRKSPKAAFQPEGLALQDTLNQFGANLKDDGIVGPKTQAAFNDVAKVQDEDMLVETFGDHLGFLTPS